MTSDEATSGPAYETIELAGLEQANRYKLVLGSVVPRPIAFVSTLSETGKINLAPFSQFIILSTDPVLLGFSVGPGPHGVKDTLRHASRNGEFVINTVSEDLAHQAQACGFDHPADVSEQELANLTPIASLRIRTPRIAESRIQFECRLHGVNRYGRSDLVVGEVLLMHARRGLVNDYKIDPVSYAALGRLGGRNYCRIREVISV